MIVFLDGRLPEEEYESLLANSDLRIERSKERGRRGEAEGIEILAERAGGRRILCNLFRSEEPLGTFEARVS